MAAERWCRRSFAQENLPSGREQGEDQSKKPLRELEARMPRSVWSALYSGAFDRVQ